MQTQVNQEYKDYPSQVMFCIVVWLTLVYVMYIH